MVARSAYSQGFLLQIQKRIDRAGKKSAKSLIQQMQKLDFLNFRTTNPNAETADLSGADLNGIDLSGVDLSHADLRYANLRYANLSGANLSHAEFRYADLRYADLRYANLSGANLKYANLSDANLNCTLLNGANLSDANLSRALLFFINLREVLNLEPLQLKAKPSPFLCNVALPNYSQQPNVNPNRACDRFPQLLSDRYNISLEEAQWIVDEARQHQWD
ncbi:MAG: pentapeptide repeat-containing protein [Pleurocapsa sp. MO_226.B13]|nr:pentapeptide repeat-containing protein [Pleurocapsa sp. MO_226.B13]